jgi:hypothetical protein
MSTFRMIVFRIRTVNGEQHYDVHLLVRRDEIWAVCGVLLLHPDEWVTMRVICEVVGIPIEIRDEQQPALSSDPAEAPTAH